MSVDRLTDADLARIAKLHAESTPGTWQSCYEVEDGVAFATGPVCDERIQAEYDQAFVNGAHHDVPRLIADMLYWRRRWATLQLDANGKAGWVSMDSREATAILEEQYHADS